MTAPQTHKTKTYVLLFLLVLLGSVGNTILSKGMKDAGDLDISHFSSVLEAAGRVLTSGEIWVGIAMMLGFMVCHMLVLVVGRLQFRDAVFRDCLRAGAAARIPFFARTGFHGALDRNRSDCSSVLC